MKDLNSIPTPRTDKAEYAPPLQSLVDVGFARQLERENVLLREMCETFHGSQFLTGQMFRADTEWKALQQLINEKGQG